MNNNEEYMYSEPYIKSIEERYNNIIAGKDSQINYLKQQVNTLQSKLLENSKNHENEISRFKKELLVEADILREEIKNKMLEEKSIARKPLKKRK